MEIAYHIGAHETDEDRFLKCLLKNRDLLAQHGTAVPNPGRYRKLMRETLTAMASGLDPAVGRDDMLEAILGGQPADRLVMSNANFCCINARVLEGGSFYALGPNRVRSLGALFDGHKIELYMGLRNPATFVPAVLAPLPADVQADLRATLDPFDLRWSDVIIRLREALPEAELTVWCNEDTPLLWSQIALALGGLEPGIEIEGRFDLVEELMTPEGFQSMLSYLETHPPQTEAQMRRVTSAFLEKFAIEDALEEELDMPGWTDETVAALSDAYEEDLYAIERLHGVTLITP